MSFWQGFLKQATKVPTNILKEHLGDTFASDVNNLANGAKPKQFVFPPLLKLKPLVVPPLPKLKPLVVPPLPKHRSHTVKGAIKSLIKRIIKR